MNQPAEKPFAAACERNQQVIFEVFQQHLRATDHAVLEIGSGTGQHAVYLAARMPQLIWQTSDVLENHSGINLWLDEAPLANLRRPLAYQVGKDTWPQCQADVIFSANTLHIMSLELVKQLIQDIGENIPDRGRLMIYGPFKYQGEFTTKSNAQFDQWLKDIDPKRGIRDIELIIELFEVYNISLKADINMPANNQFLIFDKDD